MKNLKIIYYETNQISKGEIENKIQTNGIPLCRIGVGVIIVSYDGTAQGLYDLINIPEKRMLVMDIKEGNATYWGYMQSNLWEWLKTDE